jgi:hypothetical protein
MFLGLALIGVTITTSGAAHAITVPAPSDPSTACRLQTVGATNTAANLATSRFVISGNIVSAAVKVTGHKDCKVSATLASWQAPNPDAGKPYNAQKLFAHTTETFDLGIHTISVALPDCFFQVDLTKNMPTDPNVGNSYPNGSYYGSLHGGSKACTTPTTPTPPTTPATPTQPAAPVQTTAQVTPAQPTALPNTGPGATVLGVSALATIGGTIFSYVRRTRHLGSL